MKTRGYLFIWPIAKNIWPIAKKEVMPVRTGFEQLCLSHLPQLGLKPARKGQEEKNGVGFTFVPEPEIGEGYLWTLPYQRCLLVNYLRMWCFIRTCPFATTTPLR